MSNFPTPHTARPVVLVFGGDGQLGTSLAWHAPAFPELDVRCLMWNEVQIHDAAAVADAMERHRPAIVINAAAYTAVDKAESDEAEAFRGNALGPWVLAKACANVGIPLLHVSTDYVFHGECDRPWLPNDPVGPLGAYGRTKLAGDWAVRATQPDSYIFRTSWVFSPWGNNFVKTMLRLGSERDELSIINDQHGCPTYAPDLGAFLLHVARERLLHGKGAPGIYQYCNKGQTTWFGFASAIFEKAAASGRKTPATVKAIPTSAYPTPAKRPAWSVMDTSSTKKEWGVEIPTWQDALDRCLYALDEAPAA